MGVPFIQNECMINLGANISLFSQYDVVDNVNTSATIVLDPTHEKNPYLNKLMDHLSVNSGMIMHENKYHWGVF